MTARLKLQEAAVFLELLNTLHFINCAGGVELPIGGTKRSGHGREKGFMALEEVSTTKTIVNYYG